MRLRARRRCASVFTFPDATGSSNIRITRNRDFKKEQIIKKIKINLKKKTTKQIDILKFKMKKESKMIPKGAGK